MYQLLIFDIVVDVKCYLLSYKLDDVEFGL